MIGANSLLGTPNLGAGIPAGRCRICALIRTPCVDLSFRSRTVRMDFAVRCFKAPLRKGRREKKIEVETVQGGVDVWDAATSAEKFPEHLVVMVNGIIGSADDWRYAAEQFVKKLPDRVIVHRSECNSSRLTFDGVDLMGERLAEEVLSVVKRRPGVQKISFVAHSLGGLVARYAIGRLYVPIPEREASVLSVNCLSEEGLSYSTQCLEKQQLESSRLKLAQLEQELQRARQQGIFIGSGCLVDQSHSVGGNGALAFDMDYARWLDEHQRQINDLRAAVNSHVGDNELRLLVDSVMVHYDEIFRLKSVGAKSDVFHMLSGMWKTPAERCFMWLGGFRSSELLKLLASQLEPLTDQQLMGICNLQQSSQQAEDALSQGMEALQQSLAETIASGSLGPSGSGDVANYMGQMAIAMGKLGTLENFLRQADLLRQQTLQQMHRILTTRQAARALLAISDYFSRLRALSSLWLARPRD